MERQRRALASAESDDEGSAEWREAVVASVDRHRVEAGRPPLAEWWTTKTEPQLHRRARALGLLD